MGQSNSTSNVANVANVANAKQSQTYSATVVQTQQKSQTDIVKEEIILLEGLPQENISAILKKYIQLALAELKSSTIVQSEVKEVKVVKESVVNEVKVVKEVKEVKDMKEVKIAKEEKDKKKRDPIKVGDAYFYCPPGYLIGQILFVNAQQKIVVIKISNTSNNAYYKIIAPYTSEHADKYPNINTAFVGAYVAVQYIPNSSWNGTKDRIAKSYKSAKPFMVKKEDLPEGTIVKETLHSSSVSNSAANSDNESLASTAEEKHEDEPFFYGKVLRVTSTKIMIEDWKDDNIVVECPINLVQGDFKRDDMVFYTKGAKGEVTKVEPHQIVTKFEDGFLLGSSVDKLQEDEENEFKNFSEVHLPGKLLPDGKRRNHPFFVQVCEKYIVGFLNSSRGGSLYIGVSDAGNIAGTKIEKDKRRQQDHIRTCIDYITSQCIVPQVESNLIKISFINLYEPMFDGYMLSAERMLVKIDVSPSNKKGVYETKDKVAFIRKSGSTTAMSPSMISARFTE